MTELLAKYTNRHSRFIPLKGLLTHYRMEGSGPYLLLLHGSFSSLHTYDEWTKSLSRRYTVIRLDLPGFGLTGPNREGRYDMPYFLKFIRLFLAVLDVEKCSIAGSSLGGWVAWEYALKFPNQVKKLILIDSAGFLDTKSIPLPFRMAQTPFVNRIIKYAVRKTVLEDFVKEVYFNQSKVTPTLVDRYYDLFNREGNPEAFFKMVNGKFKDNTRHLKEIKQHTLILWGKEDKWIPVENASKFHDAIPHNELIIYDLIGHLPMEEIPMDSAQDVEAFLTS